MKTTIASLLVGVLSFVVIGLAQADLVIIGNAEYDENSNGIIDTIWTGYYDENFNKIYDTVESYNLIWDDTNGLVWLDYTNYGKFWDPMMSWASGLRTPSTLDINIDPTFNVTWSTGDNWNLRTIVELSNLYTEVRYEWDVLQNRYFENLLGVKYWSSDMFYNSAGWQIVYNYNMEYYATSDRVSTTFPDWYFSGLAAAGATVTVAEPVPEPVTMLLFGTGLVGLAGNRIRRKKST